MTTTPTFDFWYAVHNTRIVRLPSQRLETFGATNLHYHLISELMDTVGQVRVREGRIQAYRPKLITPQGLAESLLEGFGDEAERYVDWLREHESDLRILQYGFAIRKEQLNEHIVTAPLEQVIEQVKAGVEARDGAFEAIVVGVEKPWEVCLIRLMTEISGHSFPGNVRELERRRAFQSNDGAPAGMRDDLESDFAAATLDRTRIKALGEKLQRLKLFSQYEDRFFQLIKGGSAG
ncbi:MAG: hypothetical protein WCL16_12455 [bacterium]